jgi:uncharacterized protein YjbI with pentapeptide repeats
MPKRQSSGVLNRLTGKTLVFSGKFAYGAEAALKAMAEAQDGKVCDDLDDKVHYLVLADLTAGKTIQKKALSLNGKGATIQVIDVDAFKNLAEPTEDEILTLLRAGESETYAKIRGAKYHYYHAGMQAPKYRFHAEDLSKVNIQRAHLDEIHFEGCKFTGATFNQVRFAAAIDCDFAKSSGESCQFNDAQGSRFNQATLNACQFSGDFSGADFTGATLENAGFLDNAYYHFGPANKSALEGVRFTNARLKSASFRGLQLKSPDFAGADLTKAVFENCTIDAAKFAKATLREAMLIGCKLTGSDLTGADLTDANLAGADLTGATLDGANVKNANLRGTKIDPADLSKAKNYDASAAASGATGPALTELDQVNGQAKRIQVSFRLRTSPEDAEERIELDTATLKYGIMGISQNVGSCTTHRNVRTLTFSDAMLQLANLLGHRQVRFETVDVSSTKSPTGGKELRDMVIRAIAEAFAQAVPAEEELAEATKEFRAAEREKGAAQRERREQAKAEAAKQKEKAKKQIAKEIEKTVGKVSDVASFLKALEVRIEKPKIDKATKMLKASGFKLFHDVTDEFVSGVVKSQTDADLVYACRVMHDGQYSCCTQNLNVCGGLRGSICKHLLVLIIGLVQAGELDPTTIDAWIAKTHQVKPELDKEVMGAVFIKYKGAEAGEVDWRPTETVPEDYYAL